MTKDEMKDYLKKNLIISVSYDDKYINVELVLENETISQCSAHLPFQDQEYDDYGNVKY